MNMKNPNFAAQMSGQVRATSPGNSGFPNLYAGGSGVIVSSTGTRHLSPVPFNSVVNRHGSMPNVSYQFKLDIHHCLIHTSSVDESMI